MFAQTTSFSSWTRDFVLFVLSCNGCTALWLIIKQLNNGYIQDIARNTMSAINTLFSFQNVAIKHPRYSSSTKNDGSKINFKNVCHAIEKRKTHLWYHLGKQKKSLTWMKAIKGDDLPISQIQTNDFQWGRTVRSL